MYGFLARYVKLRVAHAPRMPVTFSPPPRVSDPDMHHGTCVTHVPWCMPGSLYSGFFWSRWRGKRSRNPSAYATRNFMYLVSGPWQSYGDCSQICIPKRLSHTSLILVNIHPCNCLPDDTDSEPNTLFNHRQEDPISIIQYIFLRNRLGFHWRGICENYVLNTTIFQINLKGYLRNTIAHIRHIEVCIAVCGIWLIQHCFSIVCFYADHAQCK